MHTIRIAKPKQRWLFGGVGFHNSEATMTALMSDHVKNDIALKTFREISPSFSRVFAGYANWTQEAMDAFADYYDQTFRDAGTLLYLVPGRMPMMMDDFDIESYCEQTAQRLEYLIKVRKCTKIRYFCVTNELSVGNTYAYLAKHLDLLKQLHECLYKAFRRHDLDIGLIATDCSGVENFDQIIWAAANMDEVTDAYCTHLYLHKFVPGDPAAYDYLTDAFSPMVLQAHKKQKRFLLGEYGFYSSVDRRLTPMQNDTTYSFYHPEQELDNAIALCEMAMAAINVGSFAAVMWTMLDYPDPFIRENGDTPAEKARYDAARFSGAGLDYRYNKWGLIRWCDEEQDYSSRAALYTMGYMAKLFKKGSRVLQCDWDNQENIRACAVTNADGSVSIALINWGPDLQDTCIELEHPLSKPLRVYECGQDHIPYSPFNDLQAPSGVLDAIDGEINITLNPRSITFLTTDYTDREPSKIRNLRKDGALLRWDPCTDPEHCYYRVFADADPRFIPTAENQIASTIAESVTLERPELCCKVLSVDRWGNIRKEYR